MAEAETAILETPSRGRRELIGTGRLGTAAMAAAAVGGGLLATKAARAATLYNDVDIFNFALNFEYLGAQYYLAGVLGTDLNGVGTMTTGVGTPGTVKYPGGAPTMVPWSSQVLYDFFTQLAVDENAHTNFIRSVLGNSAIAMPTIDFTSYTAVAEAAGILTPAQVAAGQTFNPFASELNFILGAYLLEDVCVTALAGAAALVASKTNLAYAAGLLGVEAQQAGAIRGFAAQFGLNAMTDKISALRASLSGVGDEGTGDQNNNYNISNGDAQAQAYRRSPSQVLAIAYAGKGKSSGAIFPSGVNGTYAPFTMS